jgi:site-specific DNA-methyltransferase (adenine-specific)
VREELIGDARLILGDCREILPTLGKVDAVVTDPPYGLGVGYLSFDDTPLNVQELASVWLPICRAMAKRVAFTPGVNRQHLYPTPDWTMAWVMEAGGGYSSWGFNMWQPVLCYGKDAYLAHGKGGRPDTIITNELGKMEAFDHPCPKPIGVWTKVLNRFSVDGETILDPFMGSGTTGVACAKLGRKFIGIEIEPKYFDIACRRIEQAYKQPDFFIEKPAIAKQEAMEL